MLNEDIILEGCRELDPGAQRLFYEHFAPTMQRVCLRYSSNLDEAQDIMQEGFIKAFLNIRKFLKKGSLEGWLKRIMINTAITHFKKHKNWNEQIKNNQSHSGRDHVDLAAETEVDKDDIWERYLEIEPSTLLSIIQDLPDGYRLVFNMYFMEGLPHREIGEILQIDEITSRTRLLRARKSIQQKIAQLVTNNTI
ncbi:MAG TPA: RNA polymerase sigma factor [Cytophagaceae bacterium]|jgi:RNA polymerase sigma-70 factor (ECF subfamily)